MQIDRKKHWQFLEDELKAETEEFNKKFMTSAISLLQHSEEMFVAQFISFKDGDTNVVVNLKFNENTLATTIAPREMEKEEFRYALKEHMNDIKQILNESVE